jgi:hypothetical protein
VTFFERGYISWRRPAARCPKRISGSQQAKKSVSSSALARDARQLPIPLRTSSSCAGFSVVSVGNKAA